MVRMKFYCQLLTFNKIHQFNCLILDTSMLVKFHMCNTINLTRCIPGSILHVRFDHILLHLFVLSPMVHKFRKLTAIEKWEVGWDGIRGGGGGGGWGQRADSKKRSKSLLNISLHSSSLLSKQ